MIITVTMNPAIDKTIYPDRERTDVGGKGINVSKTLASFGQKSIATGFLGGPAGASIQKSLRDDRAGMIQEDFVWIEGNTRTNRKIADENGTVTEENEPGPVVSAGELQALREKLLEYAGPDVIFVLSGSLPQNVPSTIYAELIRALKEKGAGVMLDTSKEALKAGVQAGPDYCKPNEEEFLYLFGLKQFPEREELTGYVTQLYQYGIQNVIISCGSAGSVFCDAQAGIQYYATVPVQVKSTVGAGDAMTAGFIYQKSVGAAEAECESFAIAAATAAVTTEGTRPAALREVLYYQKQVKKAGK